MLQAASMRIIALHYGNFSLGITPDLGGAIVYFRLGSHPVMRETPESARHAGDVSQFASFPLVPFSNRIRHGIFNVSGATYQLQRDAKDPHNANHGASRHAPWNVVSQSTSSAHLNYNYAPPTPPHPSWPFAFTAEQHFTLTPAGLHYRVSLTNTHQGPAPAGIGLHPYFIRTNATGLQFSAACIWKKDDFNIPVSSQPVPPGFDFSRPRPLGPELIDHTFSHWAGEAKIIDTIVTTITADQIFQHLILYTPLEKPFFALEPVSHRPDAINPIHDHFDQPMTILNPGETLTGSVNFNPAYGR